MVIYVLRDMIARRRLRGEPVPAQFVTFHAQLLASACGTETQAALQESGDGDLIDSAEAASILGYTPRWVRHIRRDLDGEMVGGRWVFRRQTVVGYAELKGRRP